jgi:hypothetical protein
MRSRELLVGTGLLVACSEINLQSLEEVSEPPEAVEVAQPPGWRDTTGPHRTVWYVRDDTAPHETHSNPAFVVDFHGDPSLYWYEPSGAHGMVATTDVATDYERLRRYTIDGSGGPFVLDAPLDFASTSTLETFRFATFTHVLCEFWVDDGDVADWRLTTGRVDDGLLVLLNGVYVGHLTLQETGDFALPVVPGETNSVALILVDDSAVDRYFEDVALTRDGALVR